MKNIIVWLLSIFAVALCSTAHAQAVLVGNIDLSGDTRSAVKAKAAKWPNTAPAVSGNTLTVTRAKIDGEVFTVVAEFDGDNDKAKLKKLTFTTKAKASHALLKGFKAEGNSTANFINGDFRADIATIEGKDTITITPIVRSEYGDKIIGWAVIAVLVVAVMFFVYAATFQFFASLFVTVICVTLGVGLGPFSILLIGPYWFYTLWKYTQSGVVYYHSGPDDQMGLDDQMAINPANGMPMMGGMGGFDAHGNAYGSSLNDPHS